MARKRKNRSADDRLTQYLLSSKATRASAGGNINPLASVTDARGNNVVASPAATGGVGANGVVVPPIRYNPDTGQVEQTGPATTAPVTTGGAGRVSAAGNLASTTAAPGSAPQYTPQRTAAPTAPQMPEGAGVRGLEGRTPEQVAAPEGAEDQAWYQTAFKNTTHWLSDLFNTEDESDLNIAGVNLSGVESVFDAAVTGMGMAADTVNWGLSGAMLAANPHYWENRDAVGMEGNLWQDATRVSAGRSLQALASPIQDVLGQIVTGENQGVYSHYGQQGERFDISDEQHQKRWFDHGQVATLNLGFGTMDFTPQNWGSGIADFTIGAVADPTEIAGFGASKLAKFSRLRYLNRPIVTAEDTARVVDNLATDTNLMAVHTNTVTVNPAGQPVPGSHATIRAEDLDPVQAASLGLSDEGYFAWQVSARKKSARAETEQARIDAIADPVQRADEQAKFDAADYIMDGDTMVPKWEKRIDESVIFNHDVIRNATNREALTAALYNADTFEKAQLILRHAAGDLDASRQMATIAPSLYVGILNGERNLINRMISVNPELVGKQITRWQGRYDEYVRRLAELEELRADPQAIATARAELDDVMDMWEHAQNVYLNPVGTGPLATPDEIRLLQNSIDEQLKRNDLFERSILDAGGKPNPDTQFSLFDQSAKGFSSFGLRETSILPGRAGEAVSDASQALGRTIDRAVGQSRMNRAARRALAQSRSGRLGAEVRATPGLAAKAAVVGKGFLNNWKMDEFYGVRPTSVLTAPIAPIARVFRWMPTERQGFTIQTSGVGAQESVREIRAMLNGVDIYSGEGKQVLVNGEMRTVGGLAAKNALIQRYQNALLVGGSRGDMEIRKLVDEIEEQILTDISHWNGLEPELLREVHYRQNKQLEKIEKEIREEGYWTDEKGTRNYAPYLESQLQNGSFLKNWRKINSVAAQFARRERAKSGPATSMAQAEYMAAGTIRLTGQTLDNINNAMQDFWRPAVLIRLGYTQRNVAEGLFRSTAFHWSLMPLYDAAKQAGLSTFMTGRAARGAVGGGKAGVAKKATMIASDGGDIADMPRAFQRWHAAQIEAADRQVSTTRSVLLETRGMLAQGNEAYRARRVEDLNNRYAHVMDQQRASRDEVVALNDEVARLQARETELLGRIASGQTLSAKLDEELTSIPSLIARANDSIDAANDLIARSTERLVDYGDEIDTLSRMTGGDTTLSRMDEDLMRNLDYIEDVDLPFHESVRGSLDDMRSAAASYRKQTMAKRRTYGRTSTMGDPDTVASITRDAALRDPFDPNDTYADIAWQNQSSDHTMRQTASMRMKAVGDALAAQEMRYYVSVQPGAPDYFDGVASVLNQFQNSRVGELVIAGRAQGLGDAEIIDNVVRFLYEDGDGQEIAQFVNQANDIMFGGGFESSSKRAADAMRSAVERSEPLQTALDDARALLRDAQRDATSVRMQQPRPRWQGDQAPGRRTWSGDTYGDFDVASQGRGQWTITNTRTGQTVTATTRGDARRQARQLQDAEDAHWAPRAYTTPRGTTYQTLAEAQQAVDVARTAADDARTALDEFMARESVPAARTGDAAKHLNTGELDDARWYAEEVLRRYDYVTNGNGDLQQFLHANPQLPIGHGGSGRYKAGDAGKVVEQFLGDSDSLGPVIGNMAVFVGERSAMDLYRKVVEKTFRALGTIPEDTFVRSQFYGKVFNKHALKMYDSLVEQRGGADFVTFDDVNTIRNQSHRRALKDTKDWLYTIDRRTALGDTMERFIPFVSATQNSVTTVGRLIWRDPAVAWAMSYVWTLPDKVFADHDNNADTIAVPVGWLPEGVRDAIGIGEHFIVNKRQGDLIFNGVFDPQGPPLVGISSSEMMKHNWFGAEGATPSWLKGVPNGDVIWGYWKDYSLGKGGGASEYFASIDKLLAPWQKRILDGFIMGDGSSAAYSRVYQSYMLSEQLKKRNGERPDDPTHEEITEKANAAMALRAIANLTLFTTPQYDQIMSPDDPTLQFADQIRKHDELYQQDQTRIKIAKAAMDRNANSGYTTADLERRVLSSEETYGEMVVAAARGLSLQRESAAGVKASDFAVAKARENEDVIASIASSLEDIDSLPALGILTEDTSEWYTGGGEAGRTYAAENPAWSQNAAGYLAANNVPGTNVPYRQPQSTEQMMQDATDRVAWSRYMVAMEAVELSMRQNPAFYKDDGTFTSNPLSGKKGLAYAQIKQDIIDDIDKDFPGWAADFYEQQSNRTNAGIRVLTAAFENPDFMKRNEDNPFWSKSGPAYAYMQFRTYTINELKALKAERRAAGIADSDTTSAAAQPYVQAKNALYDQWAGFQSELRKSPTWAAIQDRWLGDDVEPVFIGSDGLLDSEEEAA